MKVITQHNENIEKLAKLVAPLIEQCDHLLGSMEPYAIKVGQFVFQDSNKNESYCYGVHECLVFEEAGVSESEILNHPDYAGWTLLEVVNPEVLFEDRAHELILTSQWLDEPMRVSTAEMYEMMEE